MEVLIVILFHTNSCRYEYFKNSFIPNGVNERKTKIYSSTSYDIFRNTLLKLIRSVQRGCSSDIFSSIFFRPSKSGACYITNQLGRVQNKIKET